MLMILSLADFSDLWELDMLREMQFDYQADPFILLLGCAYITLGCENIAKADQCYFHELFVNWKNFNSPRQSYIHVFVLHSEF